MICHTALNTFPGIAIPHRHIRIQLVPNGNTKTFLIHPIHHFPKRRTMRGTPLPDIKLPLMNHLMRQGSLKFSLRLLSKQWSRKPYHTGVTMSKH
jgi:hypothetical protein